MCLPRVLASLSTDKLKYSPWSLYTDARHPVILRKAFQLFWRQQTLNILDIDHTLDIPIAPILHPFTQRRPQQLSIDDKVKRRRSRGLPGIGTDNLVDQLGELEPTPVCRDKVGGLRDSMSGVPGIEVDGDLVRGRVYGGRVCHDYTEIRGVTNSVPS